MMKRNKHIIEVEIIDSIITLFKILEPLLENQVDGDNKELYDALKDLNTNKTVLNVLLSVPVSKNIVDDYKANVINKIVNEYNTSKGT